MMNYASPAWNALSALVLLSIVGCVAVRTHATAGDNTALIRLKPNPNMISLSARLEGTLQEKNGCIYFAPRKGETLELTIWPSTYQLLRSNGKVVGVRDSTTGQSLKLGVISTFGGGSSENISPDELDAPVPPICDGPLVYTYLP